MIRFQCTYCGHTVRATDVDAGRKGRCPACGRIVTIPVADPPPPAAESKGLDDLDLKSPGEDRSGDTDILPTGNKVKMLVSDEPAPAASQLRPPVSPAGRARAAQSRRAVVLVAIAVVIVILAVAAFLIFR